MFDPETATPETEASALELAAAFIRIAADPKGAQARLDGFTAASVKLREERAAGDRAAKVRSASLDEREAVIAKREAAQDVRDESLQVREETVAERHAAIKEAGAMVGRQMDLLKYRLMHYADIVRHPLQGDFSFEQVENLLRGARDAHMDGNDGTPRPETSLETEPVEMMAGGTLTRTRSKPPKPTRSDLVRHGN